MTVMRRYTFKLYPNPEQERALERQTVLLARLWNAALEQRETHWRHECQRRAKGERKGLSKFDQAKEIKFLRAGDHEYKRMAASSLEQCVHALDDAFKAFWRRAKAGAGASSGYPRYKATKPEGKPWRHYHHDTIWHRDHRKGWRLDRAGKHWRIYAKGIPGTIRARGKFPVALEAVELRDMRIMRRDDAWHCSIVVKLDERAKSGNAPVQVDFDLVHEFATVKNRADGQCLPGWEGGLASPDEQISQGKQRLDAESAVEDGKSAADDRLKVKGWRPAAAVEDGKSAADDRYLSHLSYQFSAVEDGKSAADDRLNVKGWRPAAAVEDGKSERGMSDADRRFRKGSWRWREARRIESRRMARAARRRKEALHRATTRLVAAACEIEAVCPPIREHTKSARGTARNPGAAVKTVAMLNRHVLAQAPAAALQMLDYKAAEAGIPFTRSEPVDHDLALGRELPEAGKAARKLRKTLKRHGDQT